MMRKGDGFPRGKPREPRWIQNCPASRATFPSVALGLARAIAGEQRLLRFQGPVDGGKRLTGFQPSFFTFRA
jgi:hypothetical protein